MRIRATYIKAGHVVDHYDFEVHGDEDFLHGMAAAYAHFKSNHAGASLFQDGNQITFSKV